jgi:hypothetical protein
LVDAEGEGQDLHGLEVVGDGAEAHADDYRVHHDADLPSPSTPHTYTQNTKMSPSLYRHPRGWGRNNNKRAKG